MIAYRFRSGMAPARKPFRAALLVSIALLAGGCASTIKPYPNTLPKNLQVQTETDSGALFSRTGVEVSIYSGVGACQFDYHGTMALDRAGTAIGLPVGMPSHLQLWFTRS